LPNRHSLIHPAFWASASQIAVASAIRPNAASLPWTDLTAGDVRSHSIAHLARYAQLRTDLA